jgi:D-hexose-6-phosphate mutarotase
MLSDLKYDKQSEYGGSPIIWYWFGKTRI